jgi:hypothetical protein
MKFPFNKMPLASACMKYPLLNKYVCLCPRLLLLSMGINDNGYFDILGKYPKITLGGLGDWAELLRA